MTVIYLTEYNAKCYGVNIQIIGFTEIQRFEDISDDKNFIFFVKPLEIFLGKSEVCDLTIMSGPLDKSVFDWNSILLKISEENKIR